MNIRNTYTQCFEDGFAVEDLFVQCLQSRGHDAWRPGENSREDLYDKVDAFLQLSGSEDVSSVQVKKARKIQRHDPEVSYTHTWIEIRNGYGNPGTVYGKHDWFALELKDRFLLLQSSDLRKFAKENLETIDAEDIYPTRVPYVRYRRGERYGGQKDQIVLVPIKDLVQACHVRWVPKPIKNP